MLSCILNIISSQYVKYDIPWYCWPIHLLESQFHEFVKSSFERILASKEEAWKGTRNITYFVITRCFLIKILLLCGKQHKNCMATLSSLLPMNLLLFPYAKFKLSAKLRIIFLSLTLHASLVSQETLQYILLNMHLFRAEILHCTNPIAINRSTSLDVIFGIKTTTVCLVSCQGP